MGSLFTSFRSSNAGKSAVLTIVVVSVFMSFCKKKRQFKEEDGEITVDNRVVQGQADAALRDINIVIMNRSLLRGSPASNAKGSGKAGIETCGMKLDTTLWDYGKMTLVYGGEICNGIKRTGSVTFSIQDYPLKKWKLQGCVLKIDFLQYKSTRSSDGKTVQLDGTVYLTNTSGKTWYDLVYFREPSIVQVLTGNSLKATFNGGEYSKYNFNRKMSYTYSSSDTVVNCTIVGLGSFNDENGLENWGEDRTESAFTTEVVSPLLWKSNCSGNTLYEGEVLIKVASKAYDFKCRFGLDESGNTVSAGGTCPYGWESTWSYKRKTKSRIFAYN